MNKASESEIDLDSLFAKARETEPYLASGEFVDAVVRKLPEQRRLPSWVSVVTDVSSAFIGLAILAYLLNTLGPSGLTQQLAPLFEFNVLGLALMASVSLALLSLVAWWSVENK